MMKTLEFDAGILRITT